MITEFTTVDDVKAALGVLPYDTVDDDWLVVVVDAVNACIRRWRPEVAAADDLHPEYGSVRLGATMLASRWYSRRNASDVAAFSEMGGPPPALDRDVALLLRIQNYYKPVVA